MIFLTSHNDEPVEKIAGLALDIEGLGVFVEMKTGTDHSDVSGRKYMAYTGIGKRTRSQTPLYGIFPLIIAVLSPPGKFRRIGAVNHPHRGIPYLPSSLARPV